MSRLACPRCGRLVLDGGRCDECVGRGGSSLGLLLAVIIIVLVVLATTRAVPTVTPLPSAPPSSPLGSRDESEPPAPANVAGSERRSGRRTTSTPAAHLPAVDGLATWYCGAGSRCTAGTRPGDLVAAVDRAETPFDVGDRLRVTSGDRSVVVTVVDVCGCGGRRVIDLSRAAFASLAAPSRGVIPVTVVDVETPTLTLPPTDGE